MLVRQGLEYPIISNISFIIIIIIIIVIVTVTAIVVVIIIIIIIVITSFFVCFFLLFLSVFASLLLYGAFRKMLNNSKLIQSHEKWQRAGKDLSGLLAMYTVTHHLSVLVHCTTLKKETQKG